MTMIAADKTQSWLDQHSQTSFTGHQHAWLSDKRKEALEHFENVGLPGVRDEQWRYTNLRALKSNSYGLVEAAVDKTTASAIDLPTSDNSRLVFVDGHLDTLLSIVRNLDGVMFLGTAAALTYQSELIEQHLGKTLPSEQHGFTALNTAYFQDGYVLHLSDGAAIDGVLEVYFVSTKSDVVTHTRNVIIAGANSECTVVERHIVVGEQAVYLNNIVTEIVAGDNAHIDHYKIQQESEESFHIGGVFIKQSANSQVKNHNVALTGLVTRNDICTDLLGQGAHMEMNGLVLGQGRQHIDNHTQVNHAVANCTSDEFYKVVLDDQSRSVFRGRIIVAEDAQQTNADQQNNNLLLSNDAEADTKPQLEIYADDVKCSHGATVGQLDPASLFYLQSRGIDKASANALLTFAFANEVIERLKLDSVREELTEIIAGELLDDLGDLV